MIKNLYNKTIRRLYDWAMAVSLKPNAVWGLVLVSFIESSFFPIPPDIILIPLVLAQREKAFKLALYCTIASVLGGFLGYFIGWVLDESVLNPLLAEWGMMDSFNTFKEWYHSLGAWIVFMAGLTPFPYKIITIASGALGLNLFVFTIASVLSRGGRFFFVAWLLWKWGDPMKAFIEKNLGWLSILFFILLVGFVFLIRLF